MKKRISLVLAIVMIAALFCTIVPFAVAADETEENNCIIKVAGEDYGATVFDATLLKEYLTLGDVELTLTGDITITADCIDLRDYNLTINGNNHVITIKEGISNIFRLESADRTLTISNAILTGAQNNGGCVFQLKGANTTVNLTDVTMTALSSKWYIINVMGNDGKTRTVNLTRVIAVDNVTSDQNGCFLSTGNDASESNADHTNYAVINITDSKIQTPKRVLQINKGSTADINITNSTLSLPDDAAADSAAIRIYAPQLLAADQVTATTLDATGSLIKVPAGCLAIKADDHNDITLNYAPGVPTDVTTQAPPAVEIPDVTTTDSDVTTTGSDVTTTDGGNDETTTTEKKDDETTPSATTTDGGDDKPSVTTPNATTPPPAADEGCAGCGGIAIAAQLVALICAAAVVIIKRK